MRKPELTAELLVPPGDLFGLDLEPLPDAAADRPLAEFLLW